MLEDVLPTEFESYGALENIPTEFLTKRAEAPVKASFEDESDEFFVGRFLAADELLPWLKAQQRPNRNIYTLHIHHTWSPNPSNWQGYSSLVGVADYYNSAYGYKWGKIPTFWIAQEYHEGPWGYWIATHPYYASIHCPGYNTNGYGVEVCWNGNEAPFTQEQKQLLANLAYCLNVMYGIPLQHSHRGEKTVPGIRIHRYDYDTDCPGNMNPDSLVDEVLAILSPNKNLRKGDTGNDVYILQQYLINAGYRLDTTGKFDNRTEAIVKSFQTSKMLENTGLVDSKTWNAFNSSDRVLRWKDPYIKGMDVTWVQRILQRQGYYTEEIKDVFEPRIFNGKTQDAVVKFQNAAGIEADGIVGRVTWATLRHFSN